MKKSGSPKRHISDLEDYTQKLIEDKKLVNSALKKYLEFLEKETALLRTKRDNNQHQNQ